MAETRNLASLKKYSATAQTTLNVAIVGCGLIGQKRAKTLLTFPATQKLKLFLHSCVDKEIKRAEELAKQNSGCQALSDWQLVVNHPEIDIIIIATLHASLAEIALAAAKAGKHLLIEKPAAKHSAEITAILAAAQQSASLVRVGFNHRYHRAFRKAQQLIQEDALGELMFVRARYGHGGRVGYDKEWRADPALSGGGELIDQGVHLIDLARWLLGDFNQVDGYADTFFWNMPVDDNGFMLLKTATKKVAFLHASCTEWKNTFSFEIYGRNGKLEINGLGGSYGTERITFYKMSAAMGPPETFIWEYPMQDDSWDYELAEFMQDIVLNRQPVPGLADAQAALKIVEEIYRISKP